MDPIQLFVPTFRINECLSEIRECLEKGWTGLGYKTVQFEEEWKKYTDLPNAHFINSATSGLHLSVALLKRKYGWQDGDEIITTPFTFVSTNHAILYENLKPIFADIDEYLCIDPNSILERVTGKTRAVMFVGLGGNTGRLKEVEKICKDRDIKLILDASHMSGTRWKNGDHIGREADVAIFSFQAVKNLPTADSGMICFMDKGLDAEVRKWSWMGINKDTYSRTQNEGAYKWYYDVECVGYKDNGNSIMASIGLVSLKYLESDNAYRRQLCSWYDTFLNGAIGIERVPIHPDCVPSRHLYQVIVNRRDEVMQGLNLQNIFPGVHYRDNTIYRMYSYAEGTCPKSFAASETVISLPLHLRLTIDHVKFVTSKLIDVVNHEK